MKDLSPSLIKLLNSLKDSEGGIFDRWVRVVINGQVVTKSGSTVCLTSFRFGLVEMRNDRLHLSAKGIETLAAYQREEAVDFWRKTK